MTKTSQSGATPPQLADDIQHGRTSDKVNVRDPATAPLGTDEEAAGTTIGFAQIARAQAQERHSVIETDPERSNKYPTWSGVVIWIVVVTSLAMLVAAGLFVTKS